MAAHPNASGKSPAQLLLGRPLSSFVFTRRRDFDGAWTTRADSADSVPGEKLPPNPKTFGCILPNPPVGTHVDIQDPMSKLWMRRGVIVGIGRHRDYNVKLPSGRILWRNRRYFRRRLLGSRFSVMINPHRLRLSRLQPAAPLNLVAATVGDSRRPG